MNSLYQEIADIVINNQFEKLGRVRVISDPLGSGVLLSYTSEAATAMDITPIEKLCRGLVIGNDGRILAIPFPKFWEIGDPRGIKNLHADSHIGTEYKITEKIDGTLIICWFDPNQNCWRCHTRNSFTGEYVECANKILKTHVDLSKQFSHSWTILFELCMDDDPNPKVVSKKQDLYLIGAIDMTTGGDIDIDLLVHDFETPNKALCSLSVVLRALSNQTAIEGWVVRFSDGYRAKLKTTWYKINERGLRYLNRGEEGIKSLYLKFNSFREFFDFVNSCSAGIRERIIGIFHRVIVNPALDLKHTLHYTFFSLNGIEPRKLFAFYVNKDYKEYAHWLFMLRDGKDITEQVYRWFAKR